MAIPSSACTLDTLVTNQPYRGYYMKMRTNFFQAPNFVFDSDLKQSEKLVLLYMLRCINNDGLCWPSYTVISDKCSITRKTAIEAVKTLVEKNYIIIESKGYSAEYGVKRANTYKILF